MRSTLTLQCVYLLRETDLDGVSPTGLYKIGKTTTSVENRKRQYQAGNPRRTDTLHKVEVIDAQAVETALHRRFVDFRVRSGGGDEWFRFAREDISAVKRIMDGYAYQAYVPQPRPSSHSSYDSSSYSNDWIVAIGVLVAIAGIALALLLGQFIPASSPASGHINVPAEGYDVYLRSEPQFGEEYKITQLQQGEPVTLYELSSDGQWRRVALSDGTTGWVASNMVE